MTTKVRVLRHTTLNNTFSCTLFVAGGSLTFSIVGTSTEKLTVFAASAEEKKHWIDEINNTLVNLPNVQLLKSLQNSDSVGAYSDSMPQEGL